MLDVINNKYGCYFNKNGCYKQQSRMLFFITDIVVIDNKDTCYL